MDNQIELLINAVQENLDNPEWLSKSLVTLSSQLYYHNTLMARAEKSEKLKLVNLLETQAVGNKRMSVAEAEARSVAETDNLYGQYKVQGEAIIEIINAIKMRIRVLTWEKGQAVNE